MLRGRTAVISAAASPRGVGLAILGTNIAGKPTDERKAKILEGVPLGRGGDPNDVASINTFLAADTCPLASRVRSIDVNGAMLIC